MTLGLADWQVALGPPEVAVEAGFTVTVRDAVTAVQPASALVVSASVTEPLKFAAGV